METPMPPRLSQHPVHLGLGATAVSEPEFTGMQWYAEYGARHDGDGKEGRLVSMHTFEQPWDSWEMHPEGGEVVICTAGEITLVQEIGGEVVHTRLRAGEYAINDPGVWHTADVERAATAVFITAGLGTQIRPRE
jgi:quercetin dioxygenase-like cupin family protein